ncbi:MAG: exuT [Rhodospirillales bacterium]|nr:exuT [Rhodospirillales bacterium]
MTPPNEMPETLDAFAAGGNPPMTSVTASFDWRRHRKYVVFMMFIAYFLNSIDRNIINVLQQSIKVEFHLSDAQLGLMTGFAFALFYTSIGIPTARFIDGGAVRTKIIAGGLALWSVATALCGVCQNYWQLLLCRAGVGVGEGTFGPCTMTMVSDYFGPTERARAMAIYLIGLPIGSLIGLSLGGVIADHYGWRAALLVVGLPGLLVALIIRFTMKEPPRGLADGKYVKLEQALPIGQVFRTVTKKKTVVHLLLAASFASFSTVGGMVWFLPYLQRTYNLTAGQIGPSWGIMVGLTGMGGTLAGGFLADRFGKRDRKYFMILPACSMLISFPFYIFAMISENFYLCFACLMVPAAINNAWIPAAMSLTQALAPLAMRALLGMFVTFAANLIGHGIAPPVIGALSDLFGANLGTAGGLRWALIVAAIFYPWSALHFYLASRHVNNDCEA